MTAFDSFVMLAGMRTGSNYLESNLNALAGVCCHGELFNPWFIGTRDRAEFLGFDMARRDADPLAFLAHVRAETPGLCGFRYFHDHDPRVLDPLLADRRCAKIVLTRNPLESYVSLQIARETGQWKLTDPRRRREATAHFDPAGFQAHLDEVQQFQTRIRHALQVSGQTAFALDYDDLPDLGVLNGLAAFLGVEARLEAPDQTLKKQNPGEIAARVANPETMAAALARLDRFDLSHSPSFEPRRGAGVPGFIAARGLLYMPVRGGPEQAVRDWLAALGPVQADFTRKDLRQWLRAHPGHRSFTVLRHPLARAHAVFRDHLLTGGLPDLRLALKRIARLDLPPPETTDPRAFRAAFLGFLQFLKPVLAGQTAVRVGPHLASQLAVLQGMAQLRLPDLVIREERLAEGLAFLARDAGLIPPAMPADTGPHPLADLWDAELEQAAQDAYPRDYEAFGFGPWRRA